MVLKLDLEPYGAGIEFYNQHKANFCSQNRVSKIYYISIHYNYYLLDLLKGLVNI